MNDAIKLPLFSNEDSFTFRRECLRNYYNGVINIFKEHFSSRGYAEHCPSSIISTVDDTVLFIGATISIFKPYLIYGEIPDSGFYVVQRCLRTRNILHAYEDDIFPEWGSYFHGIGTISNPNKLHEVCSDAWEFLHKKLGIEQKRIVIRISSRDSDLLEYWSSLKDGPIIEIDKKDIKFYRHQFGLNGITGRNLNFALKQKSGEPGDIGNLILIEKQSTEALGIELAFGVSTLLCRAFQVDHPIQTSIISNIYHFKKGFQTKLADSLVVSVILLREGLRPVASNRGRILRAYIQSISYLRTKSDMEIRELVKIMKDYEMEEFGNFTDIPERIGYYLELYETLLKEHQEMGYINTILSQHI